MIYIDDTDPEGVLEPAFPPRDVTIKRGTNAKELYEVISEIGRGKFGTVYKCREKATGLTLAAKFVPIPQREDRRNVEREVEIMNSLQHHLIIQLYAAYEYQKMMCVVLELVEGGELFDRVIEDEFVLSEKVCIVFIRQVCEAMQFIHRNNILHLDLKPENILCLTKEGNRIKIIDFGLARKYDPDKKLQILFGTPEFVAPEVVNFDCITYGTDMWSVGVICYVLLSGISPFMGETDIETMANVTIAKYDFEDEAFSNVSPEALDFISKLLVKDISIRMTASKCLEHKWLQRRPKTTPVIAPKTAASPPKLTSNAAKLIPMENNEEMESAQLDITKDNLRAFIERWGEHPNSPYVFDVDTNEIVPLRDCRGDSISSSRACLSPSPCQSIGSLTDEDFIKLNDDASHETEKPNLDEKSNNNNFEDYLHSFDRRNSDTNYLLRRRASGEKMSLAEEIRKLSDHLLMLAEINTKLGNKDSGEPESPQTSISTLTPSPTQSSPLDKLKANTTTNLCTKDKSHAKNVGINKENSDHNGNLVGEKSKAKSTKSSTTTTAANNRSSSTSSTVIKDSTKDTAKESATAVRTNKIGKSVKTSSKTVTNDSSSTSTSSSTTKTSSLSIRLQQSLEDTPKISMTLDSAAAKRNGFKSSHNSFISSTSTPSQASMKRMKFRVNQMSRDVPVGSPNTHQTVNLEEAANTTKDCLLHLLEKYNHDTKVRNPVTRHQSISVDWNMADNLEYRTMSSINAFFQRHTTSGRNVKQLRAQLEGKTKDAAT